MQKDRIYCKTGNEYIVTIGRSTPIFLEKNYYQRQNRMFRYYIGVLQ